jgi:hypothetical protein
VAELAAGLALILVLCHLMVMIRSYPETAIFNANASTMIR